MLKAYLDYNNIEAGCDEVGRGCLAGPVCAAAVILPKNTKIKGLNDSKKLSKRQRETLTLEIKNIALAYAVSFINNEIIDDINILNASFLAMTKAVEKLDQVPNHLLIDGNRFKSTLNIDYTCVVKGDSKFASIAAASILAKTSRDNYMTNQHQIYPYYAWDKNMGYPTKAHRLGIEKHGACTLHRKTFKLLANV